MIYLAHLCGCLWHFIAKIGVRNGVTDTWLHSHNLIFELWYVKYVNSVFYAVATMITVGVMNFSNTFEKFISIFILLILSAFFAYSINGIGNIVKNMFKSDMQLK